MNQLVTMEMDFAGLINALYGWSFEIFLENKMFFVPLYNDSNSVLELDKNL